ncbi:MAG: lactate utilization protein [Erysipelotrichaceae bacterium]|nr:lactate utilization protein [Erysipelotrichaceae bacterium]
MNEVKQEYISLQCQRVKQALEKKRFLCDVVKDAKEARKMIHSLIEENQSVSFGGSMTLEETGILDELRSMPIQLQDRNVPFSSREQRDNLLRQAFTSDVFVTSTNAITLQGELYNVDGTGNRVAAMIFGPKKVIVVCGCNKICRDMNEAEKRLACVAAPMNAIRLHRDTPCTKIGECCNCMSDDRICDAYVRIGRCHEEHRIHVILIEEAYGY